MGLLDDIIAGIDAEPDKTKTDGTEEPAANQGDPGDGGNNKGTWYSEDFLKQYPPANGQ